jgi:hypothetical protein
MRVTKKPSLAETHPDLAAQADGWDPRTVGAASNSLRRWRCSAGHCLDPQLNRQFVILVAN